MMHAPIPSTVGILTYNSGKTLARCLESLSGFADILIADGGSTDDTRAIAARYGCRVIEQSNPGHPIADFGLERNRLLDAATYDWFFYLDSDEYLSSELKSEIREVVLRDTAPYVYRVPWRVTNTSSGVVYRGFKSYYQHRFFNKKSGARFDPKRKVHERIVFDHSQRVGTLTHPWYVPLDTQLAFPEYKRRVDHRIRMAVENRPPGSLLEYVGRMTYVPLKNVGKQIVKFATLRVRYPWRELVPAYYELFKLYSEWVYMKEATRTYGRRLRLHLKTALYLFAYTLRSLGRMRNVGPEVVVLMYHAIDDSGTKLSVSPEVFEEQMRFLAGTGHVAKLADVVAYARGERTFSGNTVALTFDDGYRDVKERVLPILERYRLPATVFVSTDPEACTDPHRTPRLDWEDIRVLSKHELLTFEAHGRTHRALTKLSDTELTAETEEPIVDFERELGVRPSYFAYPFGARSPKVEDAVAAAGYEAAFAITEGTVRPSDDRYRLKRVQVDRTVSPLLFKLRLTDAVTWHRWLVDRVRYSVR